MPLPVLIPIIASVLTAGAGVASTAIKEPKDVCKKDCKEECKYKHGWLFSGRAQCIKKCRALNCTTANGEAISEDESNINWWYIISGFLIVISIIVYFTNKTK